MLQVWSRNVPKSERTKPSNPAEWLGSRVRATLETTQGQIDGFFSQLLFKFYLPDPAHEAMLCQCLQVLLFFFITLDPRVE